MLGLFLLAGGEGVRVWLGSQSRDNGVDMFACCHKEATVEEICKADVEGGHLGATAKVARIQEYVERLLFPALAPCLFIFSSQLFAVEVRGVRHVVSGWGGRYTRELTVYSFCPYVSGHAGCVLDAALKWQFQVPGSRVLGWTGRRGAWGPRRHQGTQMVCSSSTGRCIRLRRQPVSCVSHTAVSHIFPNSQARFSAVAMSTEATTSLRIHPHNSVNK